VRCPINNNHLRVKFLFLKNGFNIYKCYDCGTIMADVQYVMDQYEKDDYYTIKYEKLSEIDRFWGFRFRYILNKISKYSDGKILDYGAGNGYFSYLATNNYNKLCDGYEISKTEIEFAKRLFNIELLGDLDQCSEKYDIVTLFNVLEHVPYNDNVFDSILGKVKKNGIIVITTPNPHSFQTIFKSLKKWVMIMPPHHINLFSKKGMEEILDNREYEILKYETLSSYFSADFLTKYGSDFQIIRRVVMFIFNKLRIGADHFIIARKKQ
jgi:2-polyprenyl-3-methyl-5-hydroxy-6-metoxy-1,4-benzoquinol methylase